MTLYSASQPDPGVSFQTETDMSGQTVQTQIRGDSGSSKEFNAPIYESLLHCYQGLISLGYKIIHVQGNKATVHLESMRT